MTEIAKSTDNPRILTAEQSSSLYQRVMERIELEPWRNLAYANREAVERLVRNGIDLINKLELATHQKHPQIRLDTDVVYIDSGPGPYSYKMLEEGKSELEDAQYHKWKWTRKMDRARIRSAYVLAATITAKRIERETGVSKPTAKLTPEDFEKYGPYLMYTSTPWQNSHIRHVTKLQRESGKFLIPEDKLIMYEQFTNRSGEVKPIINTADQMEGLHFPPFWEKSPPRRIVMVSHPAHLLRILHILGKYPDSIPEGSVLQLFPISTPKSAGEEYTMAEITGSAAYVFKHKRAAAALFQNFEV